jgi:hypothetical protein
MIERNEDEREGPPPEPEPLPDETPFSSPELDDIGKSA